MCWHRPQSDAPKGLRLSGFRGFRACRVKGFREGLGLEGFQVSLEGLGCRAQALNPQLRPRSSASRSITFCLSHRMTYASN